MSKGRKLGDNEVAADQNWRSYIKTEMDSADIWHENWGFLAGNADSK